jgi:hypothetical protein
LSADISKNRDQGWGGLEMIIGFAPEEAISVYYFEETVGTGTVCMK